MVAIPDRENLETMSRTDIQKLCKDNNIKANMRTDEMINALCELANGQDAPRMQRAKSERVVSQTPTKSRLPSRNSVPPKATESNSPKKALQPSESNTDAESVVDIPTSAPTTRRKAKEIQTHLGKGRPAVAGGSGARNVTKAVSRGAGRKAKASAMLQEDPIPEEDEENAGVEASTSTAIATKAARPSSVRPQSRAQSNQSDSQDRQPSQLPTPAPSQPSYSLPSAKISALESRIAQLEAPNLANRLSQFEASMAELPALKASAAQIPALQAEVRRLEAANVGVAGEIGVLTKAHADLKSRTMGLEAHVADLLAENGTLKGRITELEAGLRDRDASTGSIIIHSPKEDRRVKQSEDAAQATPIICSKRVQPADPSPSQPTLGKRNRSETPDVGDGPDVGTQKQRDDAEREAIHRVTRPQRKKARLDVEAEDSFSMFRRDPGGPSSTSTPRQRRSDSPSGFFTAGRPVPTPLAKRDEMDSYLHLDQDDSGEGIEDASEGNAVAGPSNSNLTSSAEAGPQTPPPSRGLTAPGFGAPLNTRTHEDPAHDPGFFGDPLPVLYTQDSELPYPLNPTTPPNPQDILEQSGQYATPKLGDPWEYNEAAGYMDPVSISQLAESVALRMGAPTTPGGSYPSTSAALQADPRSPTNYTIRAGGRRERNDKYNPYFTPQRGPSVRQRTGLTPARGISVTLKSPMKMPAVAEGAEAAAAEVEEDGVERSPPQLRTMYGTELEGDTRFADYGANLGRHDWGKYL